VLRLGITTPVVTRNPKGHGLWERDAGPDELAVVVDAAERLGYQHLTCSEHIAVPISAADTRGATYWDPLSFLSWAAGRTQRLRLVPHVLVLGYHHPLEIVKRWSTLDRLSAGRVVLGVGVGSLREEFELLGAIFEGRGDLADHSMRMIRRAWGQREVDGFVMDPTAVSPLRMWVGGRTRRSLRRAVELGDGWAPFGLTDDELATALASVDRPEGFEVILWAYGLDPIGQPSQTLDRLSRVRELGATLVNVRFVADSVDHWVEQATVLAELVTSHDFWNESEGF
jgi:probable F420-dependent oxidoreductase